MAETKPVTMWQSERRSDCRPRVGRRWHAVRVDGRRQLAVCELNRRARRRDVEGEGLDPAGVGFHFHASGVHRRGQDLCRRHVGQAALRARCGVARRRRSSDAALRDAGCLRCAERRSVRPRHVARRGGHALDSGGGKRRHRGVQGGRQRGSAGSRARVDVANRWRRRGRRSSSTAWCSRSPAAKSASNAVLYALDPATGKELWNSGTTITSHGQRRPVGRHRTGARRDRRQHGICVRYSLGDQLEVAWVA